MKTVGVDIFLINRDLPATGSPRLPETLSGFALKAISNRGTRVWPGPKPDISMTDVWGCRFVKEAGEASQTEVVELLRKVGELGFVWAHVEKLHEINGAKAYTVMQGE